jgi:hypothetical protein
MSYKNVNSQVHFRPSLLVRPRENGKEYQGMSFWKPGRRTIFIREAENAGEYVVAEIDCDENERESVSIFEGLKEHPLTIGTLEAFRNAFMFRDLKFIDIENLNSKKPTNLF